MNREDRPLIERLSRLISDESLVLSLLRKGSKSGDEDARKAIPVSRGRLNVLKAELSSVTGRSWTKVEDDE